MAQHQFIGSCPHEFRLGSSSLVDRNLRSRRFFHLIIAGLSIPVALYLSLLSMLSSGPFGNENVLFTSPVAEDILYGGLPLNVSGQGLGKCHLSAAYHIMISFSTQKKTPIQ